MQKTKIFSPKKIIDTVADFYGVSVKDACGERRKKELVKTRQVIMYLLREERRESYPRIGRRIGDRDHTTAIYAHEKIKNDLQRKKELQREINIIRARLREEELQVLRRPKGIPKEKKEIAEKEYTGLEILGLIERLRKSSPSFVVLEREKSILEGWRSGKTLERIGKEWKLTRERVRQIIKCGILREIAKKQDEGFEIDIEEFLKQEKKKHGALRDQRLEEAEPKVETTKKPKRWTRHYVQCKKCGTTIIPHFKHGLCERCAGVFRGRRRDEIISNAGGKCEMCGNDRFSTFREFGRDFYIVPLGPQGNSPSNYMVLCRGCFLKIMGKKLATASAAARRNKKAVE
ncbi:MAG: hypothetical protein CO014_00210 [Candidatus Tagabacteria bacterium CG_4_8_14_3_um_filter_41_8]|uniref:Chromosomal replication initiator DnaA C-terminal domain-containing protein n=1 Tax=Candidatus Tagabacteria bacterium CG_4_8_14_3_um_filter_41_8 TaxID=1975018 RepID=A0A2M8G9L2_9BACT|nr:MAG: hypothetical protein CO014_00210 [Candidatus Tagabacteria bacterium CG_4_8_14_3_um_filter_41_8]